MRGLGPLFCDPADNQELSLTALPSSSEVLPGPQPHGSLPPSTPEVSLISVSVICDLEFISEALGLTSVPLLHHKLHLEGTVALWPCPRSLQW